MNTLDTPPPSVSRPSGVSLAEPVPGCNEQSPLAGGARDFRILIIDDAPAIHADFRKILMPAESPELDLAESAVFGERALRPRTTRFVVESAHQGEEGLSLVQRALEQGRPYALAFVDVRMPPGWDGIETVSKLWAVAPDLQVVLCTAHSDYCWEDLAERLGGTDNLVVLKKPFERVEVLQLAHALIRKWHLARQTRQTVEDLDALASHQALQHKAVAERVMRLNRLYSVLSKINELIVRARSLRELHWQACRIAVEEGQFRLAWVGLHEQETQSVKPVAYCGADEYYAQSLHISTDARLPQGQGPMGTAIREGRYELCHDIEQDPRMLHWRGLAIAHGFRSIGAFPLKVKGQTVGALALYANEAHFFNPEEVGLLEQLAADLSFATDFLEQKRQLQLQSAALEAAANTIVLTDPQGVILWHNAAFSQLTGYNSTEALGKKLSLLKSGKHEPSFYQNLWRTITAGEVWRGEIINRRKDGTLYTEETTITPLHDENHAITHYVAIKQDVTERKRAEQRLAAFSLLGLKLSSARSAKEAAQIVVEVADQLIGWDACLCDLCSTEDDSVSPLLALDLVDGRRAECELPQGFTSPSPLARRAMTEGGQLLLGDTGRPNLIDSLPFGDAARRSASILYVPIRNGSSVIGVLSIQSYTPKAYDRHSLETLQALADHCGGALHRIQTAAALGRAQEQLRQSQKMEAVGQLASGVAHDFNNLLAVMRGNTELALMDSGQLGGPARECLNQVTAAADRAANLTRQLLAFSRKQVMQTGSLNLNEVVGHLTKMLKRLIGEDIQLQCCYGARLPSVRADIGMIEQAVVNLVVNARDAMPKGGQLLVTTERASLDPHRALSHPGGRAGEFVCLSVSDTGTGISAEHLPRIFEPFFTTKEPGKGTGLGLATVYGIVQQHQGWIEVCSDPGSGSVFTIWLPALAQADPAPQRVEAIPKPRGGGETILLVEDDEPVRVLTRRLLESFGYRVLSACSGREALELWPARGPEVHLVLTDVVMPEGISGQDLARRLWAARANLPVVFMSGYSGQREGPDRDILTRVPGRFLEKPCPTHQLLETVRRCLDQPAAVRGLNGSL